MHAFPKTPPRLDRVFYSYPLYFVTLCTHQRQRILDNRELLYVFTEFVQSSFARHNIAVGRFVIMPDHIHLFIRGPHDFRLGSWVGLLKQTLSMHLMKQGLQLPVWQRGFFDHVLRSSESYSEKWAYVYQNPVRKGLVENPSDWPYAGEIIRVDSGSM
jgi:putative transposase